MGDHSESIQLDYDPTQITYQELLEVFWTSHNPGLPAGARQYASLILYHDAEQKKIAESSIAAQQAQDGEIWTELLPAGEFHWAEPDHQKYHLRERRDLAAELAEIYPDYRDLTNSTAAARINGYAGHNGAQNQLETEIDSLGLSEKARQRLIEIASAPALSSPQERAEP